MSRHKQLKNIVKAEQEMEYYDDGYYDQDNYGYNDYGSDDDYDNNYMQTSNKKKKGKKGNN